MGVVVGCARVRVRVRARAHVRMCVYVFVHPRHHHHRHRHHHHHRATIAPPSLASNTPPLNINITNIMRRSMVFVRPDNIKGHKFYNPVDTRPGVSMHLFLSVDTPTLRVPCVSLFFSVWDWNSKSWFCICLPKYTSYTPLTRKPGDVIACIILV